MIYLRLLQFTKKWLGVFSIIVTLTLTSCNQGIVATREANHLIVTVPAGLEADALSESINVYQRETGRLVEIKEAGLDIYNDQVTATLLSGRGDFDLVYLPVETLPRWVNYRAIRAMPFAPDEQRLRDSATWVGPLIIENKLYGVPAQPAPEALFYRVDRLKHASLTVPKTWEEFASTARALNQPPNEYALAMAAGPLDAGTEFAAYLSAFCGNSGCPENAETWSQALAFYTSLYQNGLASPVSTRMTRTDAAAALREGRASMAVLPLSFAPMLLEEGSGIAAAPLPGLSGASTGGLGIWAIPLNAPNPEAAAELALWLTSESGAKAWSLEGAIPANSKTLLDPEVQAKFPYLNLLVGGDDYRPLLPQSVNHDALLSSLHNTVRASLTGEATPEEAVRDYFKQAK